MGEANSAKEEDLRETQDLLTKKRKDLNAHQVKVVTVGAKLATAEGALAGETEKLRVNEQKLAKTKGKRAKDRANKRVLVNEVHKLRETNSELTRKISTLAHQRKQL